MNFSHFDLNLLKALDILLEEKNVTRAGERLCITQQAASSALGRLRVHFEDELLTRVGRRLELTPLANSLIKPVRDALHAAHIVLETTPLFDSAKANRRFSIAMSDYSVRVILPRIVQILSNEAPGIILDVKPLTKESFNRIEAGRLDFYLTANEWRLYGERSPNEEILSAGLFRDDFACLVDRDLEIPSGMLTLESYKAMRHTLPMYGQGVATLVERAWQQLELDINVAVTLPGFSSMASILPGSDLIATMQRRLAEIHAENLPLKLLECPAKIPPLQESLFWHSRQTGDPCSQFMIDTITAAARDLEAET